MGAKIEIRIKRICILILVLVIILPVTSPYFGQVLAVKPGQRIIIPDDLPQVGATYEYEDREDWDPTSKQFQVNKTWKEQQKPTESSTEPKNCAYLTLAGEKRYLIALTTTYGKTGDYIDITLKDGTEFKAVMGDAKGIKGDDQPYYYHNIFAGHKVTENYVDKCNILELILKDYSITPSANYLTKFKNIYSIANRGSYFDHPEGPVPVTETVVLGGGPTSYTPTSTSNQRREESFASVVLDMARSLITFLSTTLDNGLSGREDSGNMYYGQDDQQASGNSFDVPIVGDANVMNTCRQLSQYLMSKHAHYGWGSRNIEEAFLFPDYKVCCATYVAIVLWKSGLLTEEQINRFNYDYSGDFPNMLKAYNWYKVSPSSASPGDVIIHDPGPNGHVAIYAGNGKVWDEYSGVIESSGHPSGQPNSYDISDCQVWRAPGR